MYKKKVRFCNFPKNDYCQYLDFYYNDSKDKDRNCILAKQESRITNPCQRCKLFTFF